MQSIQAFCSKWSLPELHHLVEGDHPDRHVVIWKIMQMRRTKQDMLDFLLDFCRTKTRVQALKTLGEIIQPNSIKKYSDLMALITAVDGFDKDEFSDAMRAFCDRKNLHTLSVLSERFGAEEVVYRIAALFPLQNDEMRDELDALKYWANAKRFHKELVESQAQSDKTHAKEMAILDARRSKLEAQRAELQQKIDALRPMKRQRQ